MSERPAEQAPVPRSPRVCRPQPHPRRRPPRSFEVLCVEDHTASVQALRAVLELRPEWRLTHAGLVQTAIERAKAHPPNLVLLDLNLPDGSGADVLVALKQDPSTSAIPIVIVTAGLINGMTRRLLADGADLCWTKPLDLTELLDLLDDSAVL